MVALGPPRHPPASPETGGGITSSEPEPELGLRLICTKRFQPSSLGLPWGKFHLPSIPFGGVLERRFCEGNDCPS